MPGVGLPRRAARGEEQQAGPQDPAGPRSLHLHAHGFTKLSVAAWEAVSYFFPLNSPGVLSFQAVFTM